METGPLVVHSLKLVRGRPPSAALLLDITVSNRSEGERWASLPAQLPHDDGGVFAVETLNAKRGAGPAFARLLGPGGRLAWRMAPGATVRLSGLAITWWGPTPESVEFDVILCEQIEVGGEPLESWFDAPVAVLGAGPEAAPGTIASSRPSEGHAALPLELKGDLERLSASAAVDVA